MPWTHIVLLDLQDARVAELIDALRQEALGSGQTDPMPRVIQTAIDELRRCVAFCPNTPLDADTAAIPAGLKDLVVQKIVRTLKGRLQLPLDADEKEAEKLYQRRLEQLTRGEWPVDTPTTPIATSPVSPTRGIELANSTPRQFTRSTLGGL
ncbi:MAG: hypothetical protein V4773_04870 [Verrucomicrobiota bacterium]